MRTSLQFCDQRQLLLPIPQDYIPVTFNSSHTIYIHRVCFDQRTVKLDWTVPHLIVLLSFYVTGGIVLTFVAAAEVGMLRSLEESLGFIIEEMPINVSSRQSLLLVFLLLSTV